MLNILLNGFISRFPPGVLWAY